MRTRLIPILAVFLISTPAVASAAACCVGSTSNFGGRLGPCEWVGGGIALGGDVGFGHWSRAGAFRPVGSDRAVSGRTTLGGMFRFDKVAQMAVTVPLVLQYRRIAGTGHVGGGPGDTVLTFRFEPMPDRYGPTARPSVTFQLATAFPTGIPTDAADNPALATGTGYLTLLPRVGLQRAFTKGALLVEAELGLSVPRPGDPTATTPGAPWIVLASGSWFVRQTLTVTGSSGLRGTGPGFLKGRFAGHGTVAPWVSAGAAVKLGPGRLTVGLSSSVPLPGLGASEEARVGVNLGYTLVSKRRPGVR